MKYRSLFIAVIVTCSTIVGASFATRVRSDWRSQAHLQLPDTTPAAVSATQPNATVAPTADAALPTLPTASAGRDSANSNAPQGRTASVDLATEPIDRFPHQRLKLRDVVRWGSEFYHFREQVRHAVRQRDASFIEALIPATGISFGFGTPRSVEQLNLDHPDASFWHVLEKAIAQGCNESHLGNGAIQPGANVEVWQCPNIMDAFSEQYPELAEEMGIEDDLSRVIVVGEGVNVRAQPSQTSAVVASLTNEIVQLDEPAWNQRLKQTPQPAIDRVDRWIPVILPNGQRGYISSRYAYSPLESRVIFGQVDGKWQVLSVPSGD